MSDQLIYLSTETAVGRLTDPEAAHMVAYIDRARRIQQEHAGAA